MRLIDAAKAALEALKIGQDAFSQAFSGYGYYRPDNPHNFFPDPECCTPKEIAYHSAACEAYDKGTYVPDHSDGWITPELHVTKAPWGIGTYTDECKEITDAITVLRAAIEAAEKQEPVAWMSPGKERLEFSRPDTVYGSHTIPLYKHPVASQFSVGVIDSDGYLYPDHPLEPGTVLYTHPQPAIPAGYALVPVEPTPEMMAAAGWHSIIIDGYKAMLAAAPEEMK